MLVLPSKNKLYFVFFSCLILLIFSTLFYILSNQLIGLFIALFIVKPTLLILLFLLGKKKIDSREPIFILATVDAVFYGISFLVMYFLFPRAGTFVKDFSQLENFLFATVVNTLGWLSLVSGYILCSSHKNLVLVLAGNKFLKRLRCSLAVGGNYPEKNYRKVERLLIAVLASSLFLKIVFFAAKGGAYRGSGTLPPGLAQPVYVIEQSSILVVALATVVFAKMSSQRGKIHKRSGFIFLIVLASFLILNTVISTSKEQIGIPLAVAVYTWFLITKQFPFKLLFSLIGIYLVFAPLNTLVRNNEEVLARGKILFGDYLDAAYNLFSSNSQANLESAYGITIERLDLAAISAVLMNQVRDGLFPTSNGSSFLVVINAFLPRFIFPFKPPTTDLFDPNLIARQIGVLSSRNTDTSIAFGIPGELYLNFKLPAVIIGMFLIGYILKTVYDLFAQNQILSDLSIVTLSLPLFRFYFAYTNALFGLTNFIPIVIFTIVVMSILARLLPLARPDEAT